MAKFGVKSGAWLMLAAALLGPRLGIAAMPGTEAREKVKAESCRPGMTVEQALAHKVRIHNQRDGGWRSFPHGASYDVERLLIIGKSLEMHYRWSVDEGGMVRPVSELATALCAD